MTADSYSILKLMIFELEVHVLTFSISTSNCGSACSHEVINSIVRGVRDVKIIRVDWNNTVWRSDLFQNNSFLKKFDYCKFRLIRVNLPRLMQRNMGLTITYAWLTARPGQDCILLYSLVWPKKTKFEETSLLHNNHKIQIFAKSLELCEKVHRGRNCI
jgi:hypothetical protein